MNQKIILHIGHGKTGSSAIQAVLARNHDFLKMRGILYPCHPSFQDAKSGLITSGNLDKEDWFEDQVIKLARENPDYSTILFSNEHLFNRIDEFTDEVGKYAGEYDFEIILFVRHPLEMLNSSYQQAIKRGGFFGRIGEFADHVDHAIRAAALIGRLKALGISFKLFNYSQIRRKAVERFFAHLNVWDDIRDRGEWEMATVNRSLTHAELHFVRDLNRIFGGQYGSLISDALVNQLPDIPADRLPVDENVRRALLARQSSAIHYLNDYLDPAERIALDWDVVAEPENNDDALSVEQAAVIRRVFPGALIHSDGPVLRDIAMKYEMAEPLTREDAITLMEYAHKARPHGRIIAGKLEEWRKSSDGQP